MDNTPARTDFLPRASRRQGSVITTVVTLLLALVANLQAAAPWGGPIMQPGIAAVTCAVPSTAPASTAYGFGLFDFRNPPGALYGPNGSTSPLWNPPGYHHPSWTMTELGAVFGIAIDNDGDIYTAAHGLYSKTWSSYYHRYGNIGGGATSLAAAGTIYKIDRITGVATVFATVSNQQTMTLGAGWSSGPGFGNVCYDPGNDQFFATSLEDGVIYRINNGGTIVQTFDPMGPDNGAAGMAPIAERLWGIEVSANAVHYAVWNTGSVGNPGKIRRVNLTGAGAIDTATDMEILTVPGSPMTGGNNFVPVADITFNADGTRMVLGEQSMRGETDSYNHASRVHIAELVSGTWTVINTHETGNSWGRGEAYGGVAYGPENGINEQVIWQTTADSATTAGPHGIQGTRPADFPPAGSPSIVVNSYRVPFDPAYTTSGPDYKGSGGDVEIMQSDNCMTVEVKPVQCPDDAAVPFQVVLDITNLSGTTAHYALVTPCPASGLPAGAVTAQPNPVGVIVLATPIANNASGSLTVQLPFALAGQTVCFRVTLLDATGNACCTEKVCIDLPDCDCAEVLDTAVLCEPQADGTTKYTITVTVRNMTHLSPNPYAFAHASILPPSGFSPTLVTPSPNPIPPGAIGTFTTCYYGAPGRICFNLGLHDESLEECCSPEEICLELPDCDGTGGEPDVCKVDRRVPCCPPDDTATINYTICNNSSVTRTYNWNANGNSTAGCTQSLTPANFFPSSGSVTVPAGGCATVAIQVRCSEFEIGDCAGYSICASYNPDVPPICCEGTVYRPDPTDPVVKTADPAGDGIVLAPGETTTLSFDVENMSAEEMSVAISFRDESGIIGFNPSPAPLFGPTAEVRTILAPGAKEIVTVEVSRLDDGSSAPPFTTLQVFATREGGVDNGIPALELGVRLADRPSAGGFAVKDIRVEDGPVPRVALTVPTEEGRLYQLQQSPNVTGPWTASDCASEGTEIDENGQFRGTGEEIILYVPCNTDERRMFFRVESRE